MMASICAGTLVISLAPSCPQPATVRVIWAGSFRTYTQIHITSASETRAGRPAYLDVKTIRVATVSALSQTLRPFHVQSARLTCSTIMWPFTSSYPTKALGELRFQYDYIVVGGESTHYVLGRAFHNCVHAAGGTAGCLLARRLSDDARYSVLLVERGDASDS